MNVAEVLIQGLDRSAENVASVLEGLGPEELAHRLSPDANSIGWLVWHLSRVQDDHIAAVAAHEQLWTRAGYDRRFDLPFGAKDIGFGHTTEQVGQVRPRAELLLDYHLAVHARSVTWLADVTATDLDRIVDERWDPPVTLGVRLVSVVDECAQHVGQAAYLKGLLGR